MRSMDAALALLYMGKTVTKKRQKENEKVMEMEFSMSQRRNCSSTAYREREVHARKIRGTERERKKWEEHQKMDKIYGCVII